MCGVTKLPCKFFVHLKMPPTPMFTFCLFVCWCIGDYLHFSINTLSDHRDSCLVVGSHDGWNYNSFHSVMGWNCFLNPCTHIECRLRLHKCIAFIDDSICIAILSRLSRLQHRI